jgi:hypothetical protein
MRKPLFKHWITSTRCCQAELWFAKIERDVIARGVFSSVTDLKRKLMRYIVKWVHRDPTHGIRTTNSGVTVF